MHSTNHLIIYIYIKSMQFQQIGQGKYKSQRGSKNVINSAKKSMLSAIKKIENKNKSLLKDIVCLLEQHKVNSKASAITWMFVFLVKLLKIEKAVHILGKYIQLMKNKIKSPSEIKVKYQEDKYQKQMEFIKSAEHILLNQGYEGVLTSLDFILKGAPKDKNLENLIKYIDNQQIKFSNQQNLQRSLQINHPCQKQQFIATLKIQEQKQKQEQIFDESEQNCLVMRQQMNELCLANMFKKQEEIVSNNLNDQNKKQSSLLQVCKTGKKEKKRNFSPVNIQQESLIRTESNFDSQFDEFLRFKLINSQFQQFHFQPESDQYA